MSLYKLPSNSQAGQQLSPDLKRARRKRFYLLLLEEKNDDNRECLVEAHFLAADLGTEGNNGDRS